MGKEKPKKIYNIVSRKNGEYSSEYNFADETTVKNYMNTVGTYEVALEIKDDYDNTNNIVAPNENGLPATNTPLNSNAIIEFKPKPDA